MSATLGTNHTAGARRIAGAFQRAADEGRIALIPYVVAGYPDAETSFRVALAFRRDLHESLQQRQHSAERGPVVGFARLRGGCRASH